jgi:hypothetical protein
MHNNELIMEFTEKLWWLSSGSFLCEISDENGSHMGSGNTPGEAHDNASKLSQQTFLKLSESRN